MVLLAGSLRASCWQRAPRSIYSKRLMQDGVKVVSEICEHPQQSAGPYLSSTILYLILLSRKLPKCEGPVHPDTHHLCKVLVAGASCVQHAVEFVGELHMNCLQN
mmetsp:Transcript_71646/g.125469  ORF Transcript_71646/g.125469 Transcript_71646/m.125469 type:complete len:105 (+) Transcript_71646:532-846(+)